VGGTHSAEKGLLHCAWSADGTLVAGGSADRVVRVWDEPSAEEVRAVRPGGAPGRARARAPPPRRSPRRSPRPRAQLYALPGHAGCVNAVVFHPTEHVVASASSDKSILVGELAS
jgi:Prp8 binding protein